ncbi:sensor domain-containing diguanylate cyclase [Nocardia brasiliensis]|uniref:PAS/PAC sensor-containing diguanylate cyclase/phosphodiesterase n=1 Tax=Nocardia brasiliensis (strain ATCC 700358 / HUJEG-1) TaxID=1133849 RepID=K0EZ31_NOCB7|nr:sensor domain-containing diguanylate cyclase [Nocardia brasiliensis]AFU02752.1 PAS/PAC sensor-containing diguanylate cyclase/phosphodiesterase [Nocardia brasiliensis ATCC 700358]OCF85572.1 diguanylate cyclase [Nocardia brasiliensis]
MRETEWVVLARTWWRALTSAVPTPEDRIQILPLLTDAVEQLAAALSTEAFDVDVGTRVGARLAHARIAPGPALSDSARVLSELATRCPHPDAPGRLAALLVALGHGHSQAWLPRTAGAEQPMHQSTDDRFRVVFDNAAIAIAVGDTEGTLLEANQGLADMIGVPIEALRGISVYDFAHPEDRDEIRALVYQQLVPAGRGTSRIERRLLRADGSYGWASFAITFVKGTAGQSDYLLAVGADVTEQHQLRDELHRQARHDPLTGLPNRRHLLEQIDRIVATSGPRDRAGLCYADLDRFKQINDRYGHGVGDQVLSAIGDRFRRGVQQHDCTIARLGGDEFVALIPPPADDRLVGAVARDMLDALTAPIALHDRRVRVTASIGAVLTDASTMAASTLLDAADERLLRAKANGANCWVLRDVQHDSCGS